MYAQTRSCRRRHGSASTDNVAARLDVGAPPPSFLKDEYGLPQMVFTDLGVVSSQVPLPPCTYIAAHCTTSTLPHPHKTTCTSVSVLFQCRFCCLSAWVVETYFWASVRPIPSHLHIVVSQYLSACLPLPPTCRPPSRLTLGPAHLLPPVLFARPVLRRA